MERCLQLPLIPLQLRVNLIEDREIFLVLKIKKLHLNLSQLLAVFNKELLNKNRPEHLYLVEMFNKNHKDHFLVELQQLSLQVGHFSELPQ